MRIASLFLIAAFGIASSAWAAPKPEKKPAAPPPREVKEEGSSQSMASFMLQQLNEREQEAYRKYERALAPQEVKTVEAELQSVIRGYDKLIGAAPDFVPGLVSYGLILMRVGEREASYAMFAKADELDPYLAVVKNQLGNYQAEEGKYAEALGFYLLASQLEPKEPLYHHQIANLLLAFKRFFVADKVYQPTTIDMKIQEGFREAAMLDSTNFERRLRYAQSFFDVTKPRWDLALDEFHQLADLAHDEFEKQLTLLYTARVRFEMGHHSAARKILKGLDHPNLDRSKAELLDMIDRKHPK